MKLFHKLEKLLSRNRWFSEVIQKDDSSSSESLAEYVPLASYRTSPKYVWDLSFSWTGSKTQTILQIKMKPRAVGDKSPPKPPPIGMVTIYSPGARMNADGTITVMASTCLERGMFFSRAVLDLDTNADPEPSGGFRCWRPLPDLIGITFSPKPGTKVMIPEWWNISEVHGHKVYPSAHSELLSQEIWHVPDEFQKLQDYFHLVTG